MNRWIGSLACCVIGCAAAAGIIPEEYALVRRLQLTEPTVENGIATWNPDADFFVEVDDLQADWRVTTPAGREIAARIIRVEDPVFSASYEVCPSRISASGRLSGSAAVSQIWELELARPADELSAVELKITNRVFEKRLTVEIADEDGDWHRAISEQPLIGASDRDFTEEFRIYFQHRGSGKKVRVTLTDSIDEQSPLPAEELKIDTIRLLRRAPEPLDAIARRQPQVLPPLQHTVRNQRTALTFDARRVPLSGFELQTGSRNFSRRFHLHGSEDLKGWRTVTEGMLHANGSGLGELSFNFDQSRYRYYLLEIDNGAGAELENIRVKWEQVSYRMVISEALPALHLYFSGDTERPAYPDMKFTPGELQQLPEYQALPPEPNPKFRPFIVEEQNYRSKIYILLAAVSVTIGGVLLLAMRHLKKHPTE